MRILIIEDDHKIAGSIKKGLEQESFAVDVAHDGIRGFDLAVGEDGYDVIILDLMLPGMNGIELCERLREEENIHTPVIMLTAKGEVGDRVDGLNAGADDYLPKPFAFAELLARIKALTRRPSQRLENILTASDLSLDTNTYDVKRGERQIELSKKEYSLLQYLLRNKGRTLSKESIMRSVWDYDADILPNTVEVYIGYLRSKIDKPFKNKKKLIKTVRGFGYRIEDE